VSRTCRQPGISEQTFYGWKKQSSDLGVGEVREMRQLREENRRLKTAVAGLTLDKTILQATREIGGKGSRLRTKTQRGYCGRSAVSGVTRQARRVGTHSATAATTSITAAQQKTIKGSTEETPVR
jgi:Transposase